MTSLGTNGINGGGPFGDASLVGTTNEFRVYNNALTAAQAAASFRAGPTVVPEPAALGLLGVCGIMAARRRRVSARGN